MANEFDKDEIQRYSRQLLLPQFGTSAQARLKRARVLVIGLGGLGSPCALYLCGAGIGTLGLMDGGSNNNENAGVDISNLHRQVAYTEADARASRSKPTALACALRERNNRVNIITHDTFITPANSVEICGQYSVVLDCTDNVRARYVIGDACAAAGVTLVSGAAIGLHGQLSVHYSGIPTTTTTTTDDGNSGGDEEDNDIKRRTRTRTRIGGCYRCVFPCAPPPQCVGSCDAAGVLGPVPGVIGTLMAIECIKVVAQFDTAVPLVGRLLIFDAADGVMPFRSVKLRQCPRPDCIACGPSEIRMNVATYDYDMFLGIKNNKTSTTTAVQQNGKQQKFNNEDQDQLPRISVHELKEIRNSTMLRKFKLVILSDLQQQQEQKDDDDDDDDDNDNDNEQEKYTLIDVRPANEFAIARLDDAVNIPVQQLTEQATVLANYINRLQQQGNNKKYHTILICRRGNASRRALRALLDAGAQNVKDVVGGLQQWCTIDSEFPMY